MRTNLQNILFVKCIYSSSLKVENEHKLNSNLLLNRNTNQKEFM